jgi:hypothetical protein
MPTNRYIGESGECLPELTVLFHAKVGVILQQVFFLSPVNSGLIGAK